MCRGWFRRGRGVGEGKTRQSSDGGLMGLIRGPELRGCDVRMGGASIEPCDPGGL